MQIRFSKYQGAGNDFILIDDRANQVRPDVEVFNKLCDRRFGIGADGIMLVRNHKDFDFEMLYFNADGREGSMCGNGGRCIATFARDLGITGSESHFIAVDGPHRARITGEEVSLEMKDVNGIEINSGDYILDTGSPHLVRMTSTLQELDIVSEGRSVRYNDRFRQEGINVNFVEPFADHYAVRTYERGVENETYACGTGVTAVALAMAVKDKLYGDLKLRLQTKGGLLTVRFHRSGEQSFSGIYLSGPATFVFKGEIFI
ncbi:diaminopimelate epimerase [Anseongella ginsenosidimutans]|uniref:Diaminopimelate epimerase n=1 Tax=Anseongella ginsenosidimutans TaxID=496056 RepID=A0A4R3KWC5_9SPHI|nr:diaminopimelate epimerase [Anseongella ginsenosidimutans]QEC51676.1 diaminopimelate epimerase [Anseongella ginsenosidimutans]TCS89026.1 diaminopimelate epimerase [Anseongella ginsenosidimutans]